jgi:hypothetical protein
MKLLDAILISDEWKPPSVLCFSEGGGGGGGAGGAPHRQPAGLAVAGVVPRSWPSLRIFAQFCVILRSFA